MDFFAAKIFCNWTFVASPADWKPGAFGFYQI